jgi:signal transduction histidine kinase
VLVVFTAIAIGLRQYRSVMRPLNRMSQSVQNFAAGQFDERISATGDREFVSLANDFNFMAGELEGLYRQLEQKVAAKSKELVRSERLASVGYLAAGVAHEINNPLGIIAGYGERSLQHLYRGLDETTLLKTESAIKIICSEAFRCKEITDRLLSLARPGSDDRCRISLRTIIQEVISNLSSLPEYTDRRITLQANDECDSFVIGKEGEVRQVLVNLILNALEATLPAIGRVDVSIRHVNKEVEIIVRDNGRGMTPDTLEHIFEPFFTEKRGQQRPGTGLGLSITHAIVLDHGGRVTALSDGLGKGSRFIIYLPAAKEGVELVNAE